MTVSYSGKISTANKVGAFLKLLFVWKGSVYRLIWFDYAVYLTLYFFVSAAYRFGMTQDQMRDFEGLILFCDEFSSLIPLTFVLAFYVSHVVSRWWAQWNAIPWPDSLAFKVNAYCQGKDDQSRLIRRNLVRYACLAIVDTLRMISSKVKKRFPTYEHLVDAGLMTESELLAFRQAQSRSEYMDYTYWVPISWASSITVQANRQGYIDNVKYVVDINEELAKLRTQCGVLISYDWVSLPLVYVQVVTLAVYSFFGVTLIGRQWVVADTDGGGGHDYFFPIFTSLQFIFYVGWMKVAEALLNPFGEDDEDFDTNWMVDRHLQLSYLMVDEVGQYPPHPEKDPHWYVGVPDELPYTVASLPFRGSHAETGAQELEVPIEDQRHVSIDENGQKSSGSLQMLNQLFSHMVHWASSPLNNSNGGGVRTCSTSSAPVPFTGKRNSEQQLQRNASLRKSFKPGQHEKYLKKSVDNLATLLSVAGTGKQGGAEAMGTLKEEEKDEINTISIFVPSLPHLQRKKSLN